MNEIEKTYLVRDLPDLNGIEGVELRDIYFPLNSKHPSLRMRQQGDKYEITKKEMIDNDPSHQKEHNIHLTKEEFESLSQAPGRRLCKIRYRFPCNGYVAEVDVFTEDLEGLILADFEFDSLAERDEFTPPSFCAVDVTGLEEIAGGMLCGKTYDEIKGFLPA